ncbi:hypothetical protein [Solirubrobacter soli]|uniref:hypothetical protein n=1 Tax=Solirubrobacter soli TaxID=363832 RepID=UPI000486D1AA|nr:hypothetical protein [Solirubrobacter soli]
MGLKRLAVALAVVVMVPAGSASAEVRSGSVADPVDSPLHQNVDGTSYRDQDIQRVTASYDTAGSLTMTFYFLDPVPASTPDTLQASFSAASCDYATGTALLLLPPSSRSYSPASVTLSGYEGSVPTTRTLSADHRAITVQASAPALANRDYGCVHLISLWRVNKVPFHCDTYPVVTCTDLEKAVTDDTTAFSIDAATPAIPSPEPEGTATQTPTVTPTDPCGTARDALRKKKQQAKKLTAQRRAARTRQRKRALTKQLETTKRGIANAKAKIDVYC